MPTRVLIIAEKPSSGAKIAEALAEGGVEKKGRGAAKYFEFTRGGNDFTVVPAAGHLYGLREREKSRGYPVFDVEWAPSFTSSKQAAFTKAYLDNIVSLAKKANEFYSACDYDIEGEVIGANVLELGCGVKKARRMKFSTLTVEELREAFDNAMPELDHRLVEAGRTRHKLDFFWGISLSRALMTAIKAAGRFQILSVGRVQGPALAVICRREKDIAAFKPVPYWQVFAEIKQVIFEHSHGKFDAEAEAKAAVANAGTEGVVTQVKKAKFNQMPPFPFDLTTLQTEAYKAFGFTPTQTLDLAQKLYEQAVVSYPRTSSQQLSEKLNLPEIMKKIAGNKQYAALANKLLQEKLFTPHNGKQSDPAHPALYPTGVQPQGLSPHEQKLYDLIAKRFLACFAKPAVRERMSVTAKLGSEDFSASGSRTLEANWLEFYSPYAKFEEVLMPAFEEGEKVKAKRVWDERKETQPPKRFTQASIVRKLEEDGLGTKATRAGIVQTLFDRGYVTGKSLEATPLGMSVFSALEHNAPHVLEESLTRHFEEEIEAISQGTKPAEEVVEEGKKTLTQLLDDFRKKELAIGKELLSAVNETQREASTLGKCNLCATGNLVIRRSKYGLFVGCSGYPNCRNTFPLPKGALVKPAGKTCEKCGTPMVLVIRKGRRPWSMCLLPTCETKANWGAKKEPAEAGEEKTGEAQESG